MYALLRANDRLSQRELADRAGVSTQSLRNNRDVLKAIGLVSIDGNGWRLQLSFRTTEERRAGIAPDVVSTTFIDAVSELLETRLPPQQYGDPEDPLGRTLFWPPNPWSLTDHPDIAPWIKLAARLTGTEQPGQETPIAVGPPACQQSLTTGTRK
ncbi:winged helix-turn-helix domain-containing protein [Natronococcus sp. A-GB7]|nr:winged helix-turn-helix domain-containing protein [Natronococcus sp. A-GB7]MDG5821868.1 winged helix-turn-helix domain-containing protein [Natronococcus sp. A-GB7]